MNRIKPALIAVMVVFAPLPVGGYEAWLLPILVALSGLALLLTFTEGPSNGRPSLVFWGTAAAWGLIQILWIYTARDVSFYLPDAVVGLEYSVLDVSSALTFMLRLLVYGAIVYSVSRMHRREVDIVAFAVVMSASFQSLYGLVNYAAGNHSIFGIWDGGMHQGSVMGTFYSRNQLAGYLALALPLGLAWLWRLHAASAPRSGRRGTMLALVVLYAMLLSVALVGSASRLGVTSAIIGLLAWAWLSVHRRRDPDRASGGLVRWIGVTVVVLALLWFGPGVIGERFLGLSISDAI